MMKKPFAVFAAAVAVFFLTVPDHQAMAGEPTEKIKETTNKILSIVTNADLKAPGKEAERRKSIRKAVDERFDWEEMARRSLGTQWGARTPEEKKHFVDLFGDLLERTYLDRVEGYSGEKVYYLGERLDGQYAEVDVKIVTTQNTEVPVKYRLRNKSNNWLVYDISIAGVSLVNNYRVQFSSILAKSTYQDLVKQLEKKVAEGN
ncbi:MAG: organic solvent tolerance ABC transporter substrate-binding protein [Deltaproteobacteria bacterium HGW-Deltaproteobacteria-21]|nr:MAG: organic solvent tolerance ABC transporter substrate-binding protein [Deltaproteobacteria bacterium HGW-Deltaproteobacteria-21]